ncbi:hypothetical protein B0H66DRAFT_205543 [Apodospora peruviana]|uniref:Vacuolar ATPase assembly protein VMA22 n=1 Tax=Apodospora peruviana TaxID=516989 RepID=A0AAE0ID15_9PEZI|nr:hypothetical protein B0H66DRAFT_205543 [Apodospora peruviana]
MAETTVDLDTTIDTLLERYLTLLDEYTRLRARLNGLQSGIYQNLARANFSAQRGVRYGQDHYDDRMQAARRVQITQSSPSAGHHVIFDMIKVTADESEENDDKNNTKKEDQQEEQDEKKSAAAATTKDDNNHDGSGKPSPPPKKRNNHDPLRWFGLLSPQPLRLAQAQAVQAVEEIIPRLASLSAAMADVELQVRRARKKRSKAEKVDHQKKLQQQEGHLHGNGGQEEVLPAH